MSWFHIIEIASLLVSLEKGQVLLSYLRSECASHWVLNVLYISEILEPHWGFLSFEANTLSGEFLTKPCLEDACLSSMYVCMYTHICTCVYCMHVCTESRGWCLVSSSISLHLMFWVRPFTVPTAHRISHTGFWPNPRNPPASTSPTLGLLACSLHQVFSEDLQYDLFLVKSRCYHPPNVEKVFYNNSMPPGLSTDYV